MKNFVFFFALIALIIASCGDTSLQPTAQLTKAEIYFPLHVGDQWQYQFGVNAMRYDNCDAILSINKNIYYRIITSHTGNPYIDTCYYRTQEAKVFKWKNNEEWLYADFAELNTGQPTPYYQIIVDRDQVIKTPAGTFSDCVSTINSSVHVDGDYYRNIAPMVGTVRMTGESPEFLITYAKINGKEYGRK